MSEFRVRPYCPEDSSAIGRLFYDTVRTINSRDYSPAQIAAWVPAIPAPDWAAERERTRIVFVAEDAKGVVGFAELRPDAGHLDCLYTRHDSQGRGVATLLLREVEARAGTLGLTRLRTEASITARPFFERRGFTLVAQQKVKRGGVDLTNFKMEKELVRD